MDAVERRQQDIDTQFRYTKPTGLHKNIVSFIENHGILTSTASS